MFSFFVAKGVSEKANKKLDAEKRAELFDIFSNSKLTMITTGILIASFFVSLKMDILDPVVIYFIYMLSLLIFILYKVIDGYKKLKMNDFPVLYIKSFLFASGVRFLGLFSFCLLVLTDFMSQ
ncbi:hypothetical protein NH26_17060 [Flammeovirga pacifica]|uniref:Uncharacterized protein n=2 Tax=Flammeovirga pacifica TaxID=915059 RepID=A0A1S1Z3X6_FLAPC|nr:hypothetical protein NH26_17060 [Flammeovirga pacifica]